MSLPHEEAARKKYPTAKNFEAVTVGLIRPRTIGWVFMVTSERTSAISFAWITTDMQVTAAPVDYKSNAASYLREYVRTERQQGRITTRKTEGREDPS